MAGTVLRIIDGPDKPALQWALTYPDKEEVHFRFENDSATAKVEKMVEQPDGVTFEIEGTLTSGAFERHSFRGSYSVGARNGSLMVRERR